MRKSQGLLIPLFAAVVIAASAFSATAIAKPLKLAYSTWVGYGPWFIAQEKGYFKQEGVDVELINIEDPKLRFAALAAGRLDALCTTVDTLLLYLKPGIKYQYLFAIDDSNGGDGVVANKDIKSVADLKGKKVAFLEGSTSHFYLSVLLRKAGLREADIDGVNMTAGDAGSAFVAGQVDAAVTWEPWLTRGKMAPQGHLLTDSSTTPGLITDIALAPVDVIKSRAGDLKALARAWNRAVQFVKSNPDEANAIMAKGVGGWLKDPKVFAETLQGIVYYDAAKTKAFFGTSDSPGPMSTTVQNAIDIWSDLGKVQVPVTPKDLVNYDFIVE
ncbi:MAG: ABC transporter substrate-binding protein [Alphaproteobacteria bacterium]